MHQELPDKLGRHDRPDQKSIMTSVFLKVRVAGTQDTYIKEEWFFLKDTKQCLFQKSTK